MIGHLHPCEGEPSEDIRTRVYSFVDGMMLDYVYEVKGDALMIWGGEKDSPSYYQGTFSRDDCSPCPVRVLGTRAKIEAQPRFAALIT